MMAFFAMPLLVHAHLRMSPASEQAVAEHLHHGLHSPGTAVRHDVHFPRNMTKRDPSGKNKLHGLNDGVRGLSTNAMAYELRRQAFAVEIDDLFRRVDITNIGNESCQFLAESKSSYANCWVLDGNDIKETIVTLATDIPEDYMQGMRYNRLNYITNHPGTRYCEYRHKLDDERDARYSKWLAVEALARNADERHRFVYMDADALIMQLGNTFPTSDKDLIMTTDRMDPRGRANKNASINSGVFAFTRNSHWARTFCSEIGRGMPESLKSCNQGGWCDQKAVLLYRKSMRADFEEHVEIIPWDRMNSISENDYEEGDFVLHIAGGARKVGKYEHLYRKYMSKGSKCCFAPSCAATVA